MLRPYLKRVYEIASRGDAREESYYSTLEELLDEYGESIGKKNIHVTTLPKRTEAGNPDFRIWDGNQHIVGYIEAKAPTVGHLDQIETMGQLRRYIHTFPNLILTNFFEFRLYRNGNLIDKSLIARPYVVHKLKSVPPVERESEFFQLLNKFFSFSLPKVYDAKALAIELAKRTRFLKDEVIVEELKTVEQTFLSDTPPGNKITDVTDKNVCSTNIITDVANINITPEEIFYYIYAVLYSNIYRTKYAEFLKIDFPRVPFTKDYDLFSKMGGYGKRLVDLHLLKSGELDPPVAKFQGKGENKIEKLRYVEKENRVYINQNQYFEGIPKEVWEYQIGGYQVCDKWLKDRKGRPLDDIRTYCRIATAIQKTIEIQKAIDIIYPEAERETVLF